VMDIYSGRRKGMFEKQRSTRASAMLTRL
jgi:hypothetical protein